MWVFLSQIPQPVRRRVPDPSQKLQLSHHVVSDDDEHRLTGSVVPAGRRVPTENSGAALLRRGSERVFQAKVSRGAALWLESQRKQCFPSVPCRLN